MSENAEQNYNAKKYRTPDGVPADIVMFTLTKRERKTVTKTLPLRELKVMLIRRKKWPCEGMWALPGGFCQEDESIYDAATRELKEEIRCGRRTFGIPWCLQYTGPGSARLDYQPRLFRTGGGVDAGAETSLR